MVVAADWIEVHAEEGCKHSGGGYGYRWQQQWQRVGWAVVEAHVTCLSGRGKSCL